MSGCGVRWHGDSTHTCYCHPYYPNCDGHNHVCMCGSDYVTKYDTWEDLVTVCMKHKRFVPCRACMYGQSNGIGHWNSTDPADVAAVREYQQGQLEQQRQAFGELRALEEELDLLD